MRVDVSLKCQECRRFNYISTRNKNQTAKIAVRKYCSFCKHHVLHKEK